MKKSFLSALIFFGTLAILTVGYATWNNPFTMNAVGSGSGLTANNWNALVNNINDLNTRLTSAEATITSQAITISTLTPSGAIMAFNLTTCPGGWSEADGGGTPARPNLQGEFIRGWNRNATGADGGRGFGSLQGDAIRNITGFANMYVAATSAGGAMYLSASANEGSANAANGANIVNFDASRVVPTANENRPHNIAFLYCIKN